MFLRYRIHLAIGAVLFAMGCMYNALHTSQGLQSLAKGEEPLDPGAYRAQIVDVEAALFAPAPLTKENRTQLVQALDTLRRELEHRGGTHMARYSGREIRRLAGMSRGRDDLEGAPLEQVRNHWMRIRPNTFHDDASWFRFSENDPVAEREEPKIELSARDRATLDRLRSTLERIDDAIARGTRDCERLGEPETGMDETRGEALAQAWRNWGDGWKTELENIRSWMPEAPAPDAPAGVRFVFDSVDDALTQLEAIPGSGRGRWNALDRQDWERRFQGAAKEVRDARFWIDRAEKASSSGRPRDLPELHKKSPLGPGPGVN